MKIHSPDSPRITIGRRNGYTFAPLLLAIALLSPAAMSLGATDRLNAGQWWGTLELGAGQLDRTAPGFANTSGRFYLGFEGGLAVNPQVLLGVELSGWLIQSGNLNDPAKGSGISQVFAVTRIYPRKNSPLHVQLGAGAATLWSNSAAGSSGHGTGWEAGIGYDVMVSPHVAYSPFLRYNSGKAGNLKLSAVTIGVGLTWR